MRTAWVRMQSRRAVPRVPTICDEVRTLSDNGAIFCILAFKIAS